MTDKISFDDGDFKLTPTLKAIFEEREVEGKSVYEIYQKANSQSAIDQQLSVEKLDSGYRITHTTNEFDIMITGNSADLFLAKILNNVFGIEVEGL